jgi:hypothetical protein
MPQAQWTQIVVSGALTDSLVTDFDAATGIAPAIAVREAMLCATIFYQGVAAVAVNVFLAPAAGAALNNVVPVFNSATLTPATASSFSVTKSVPLQAANLPLQLRITKGLTNASIWIRWDVILPGQTG